jgi:peptidyl-prolyl cis-trans isomerase B (cyclophilin B)
MSNFNLLSAFILISFWLGWLLPYPAHGNPPFEIPQRREVVKIRSAIIETSQGKLFVELYPEDAPVHVSNFKYLADKGFYSGTTFHLYRPGYLIQGGDPKGTGLGGPGYTLSPEFSRRNHVLGTLGMARKPDTHGDPKEPVNPQRRSDGSQFHILLGDAPHLDGNYTIFGRIVGGIEVLQRLREGDQIGKVTVFIREDGR